jgi:1-deoxy-D-xylulose-5-phosphate reductoisomerase
MKQKQLAIIGATGSIGTNALQVVSAHPDLFEVTALATHTRLQELWPSIELFSPSMVAMTGRDLTDEERERFQSINIQVFTGSDALIRLAQQADYDLFVNAVVGAAGFLPTLRALERGRSVALANKESLVMGGHLVMATARNNHVQVIPIDSEHSAIYQCLMGEDPNRIESLVLTASGGPFRKLPREQFAMVTVAQALDHPNWSMGPKITIDSATMMNKGLEVIEAHWLFDIPTRQIDVLIHPQSIIHSMVQFTDGSIKAQMGVPDMRVPIQLALSAPERLDSDFPRLDFRHHRELTFEEPDLETFRCLNLAFKASATGGSAPAVMNAANEEAVSLFLNKQIRFDQIPCAIEDTLIVHQVIAHPDEEQLLSADRWARSFVRDHLLK